MTPDRGLHARLRAAEEIVIETRRGPGAAVHRTTIWVVVDDRDRILVRTYRGPGSRWYRELDANPVCVVELAGERWELRSEPAADPDRVASASEGYLRKYAGHGATPAMVADPNLSTTRELLPR